jgi:sRNA-binding protein
VPLKRGIRLDILWALDGVITPKELRLGLTFYCGNPVYLQRLREGAPRIGLGGEETGYVTAAEAQRAADRLAYIKARIAARKVAEDAPDMASAAAEVVVSVQAVAVAAGPRRLSLSDLKAAALERRTSAKTKVHAEVF